MKITKYKVRDFSNSVYVLKALIFAFQSGTAQYKDEQ